MPTRPFRPGDLLTAVALLLHQGRGRNPINSVEALSHSEARNLFDAHVNILADNEVASHSKDRTAGELIILSLDSYEERSDPNTDSRTSRRKDRVGAADPPPHRNVGQSLLELGHEASVANPLLVGQLPCPWPFLCRSGRRVHAPDPPTACRRSRSRFRRADRFPPHSNGVGSGFQWSATAATGP